MGILNNPIQKYTVPTKRANIRSNSDAIVINILQNVELFGKSTLRGSSRVRNSVPQRFLQSRFLL